MEELIAQRIEELRNLLVDTRVECSSAIASAAGLISEAYRKGRGVFVFGNGGSAADAQHIVGELNGRFLKQRRAFKAQSLVGDNATLTAVANDYGYDHIFVRQLEANGGSEDIAWGISTSGNSPNVVCALRRAKEMGMKTIVLSGAGGGQCAELADVLIAIPSTHTPHIQEAGMAIYHLICEQVEMKS